ncbi:MAG: class I SAM-dependent methyltransferase [Peptococcaceae bacterium]|nr:class I SAM-dependent methyltransferase [Peptococcaceae bacterium]
MKYMKCQICSNEDISTIYDGQIRDGGIGRYTDINVNMYQCQECGVIWHNLRERDLDEYYSSEDYRQELEGTSSENDFYRIHDGETLDKLYYTGTTVFRDKIVADLGCAAGAFLDSISGMAKTVIGIEPSNVYQTALKKKGYCTFAYASDAIQEYGGKVDVLTSFDVIEHVSDPLTFLKEVHALLREKGKAIIGTPTDAPVMRAMLGQIYEKELLFSTQHLWVFNQKSLMLLAKKAGFRKASVRYFQRYGLGNALSWLKYRQPKGNVSYSFITDTMDIVWKKELEAQGLSDYIVLNVER